MAKFIPLPNVVDLPDVVLFHKTHPRDQRLLLQVPTGPDTAETYVIRLDQPSAPAGEYDPRQDHKGWMRRLPNSQGLTDMLALEAHVAYYPQRGGVVMPLEDPDTIPWMTKVVALARREGHSPFQRYFARRAVKARTLPQPYLRTALRNKPGGAEW